MSLYFSCTFGVTFGEAPSNIEENKHRALHPCFLNFYSCESIGLAKKEISGECAIADV